MQPPQEKNASLILKFAASTIIADILITKNYIFILNNQ